MVEIQYFKATKQTNRFRQNQKVWIQERWQHCYRICFKWRGSGRYVRGVIGRNHKAIGEIKTIEVSDTFAQFIKRGDE